MWRLSRRMLKLHVLRELRLMIERVVPQIGVARGAQVRVQKVGREVHIVFVLETAPMAVKVFELIRQQLKSGLLNLLLPKPKQVVEMPNPPNTVASTDTTGRTDRRLCSSRSSGMRAGHPLAAGCAPYLAARSKLR